MHPRQRAAGQAGAGTAGAAAEDRDQGPELGGRRPTRQDQVGRQSRGAPARQPPLGERPLVAAEVRARGDEPDRHEDHNREQVTLRVELDGDTRVPVLLIRVGGPSRPSVLCGAEVTLTGSDLWAAYDVLVDLSDKHRRRRGPVLAPRT